MEIKRKLGTFSYKSALNFEYTDIQLFQWIICRLCPTIFPGNLAEDVLSHVSGEHRKPVKVRICNNETGTVEIYEIDPNLCERVCKNYRLGILKRRAKSDHSIRTQSWAHKNLLTHFKRKRKDSDPDYNPDEPEQQKKTKKPDPFLKLLEGKENLQFSLDAQNSRDKPESKETRKNKVFPSGESAGVGSENQFNSTHINSTQIDSTEASTVPPATKRLSTKRTSGIKSEVLCLFCSKK